jgi:hypothetical protein
MKGLEMAGFLRRRKKMSTALKINESDPVGADHPPRSGPDKSLDEYQRLKGRYLALCRRYGLNPFDLDILSISVSRMPRRDKSSLVGFILRLIRFERALKHKIAHGLFPLTVSESARSGYLVPTHRLD